MGRFFHIMKYLFITDLHLEDKFPGYLDAQIKTLEKIIFEVRPKKTFILGDVFMYRKPSPKTLLGFKRLLSCYYIVEDFYVLRGNHDSETKADDGITALSLFESADVHIIEHTKIFDVPGLNITMIPHYEDQARIINTLKEIPKECDLVLGHFGFTGSLNSQGDSDFNINLDHFKNKTFLGHIHTFSENENVTVLGTQYTTNFGEFGKTCRYGVFDTKTREFTFPEVNFGIRHVNIPSDMLGTPGVLEELGNPEYQTLLRITRTSLDTEASDVNYLNDLKEKLNLLYIDSRFIPQLTTLTSHISSDIVMPKVLQLDESLIEVYAKQANVSNFSYEDIMEGYQKLK